MSDRLAIWLDGRVVAVVEQERRRLRLEYTTEARERYPGGMPLLSLSLPVSATRYPNGVTRAFLDGLLPEGDSRRVLAEDFRVRADNTFGLIRALGRDCAGALVIQDADDPPPPDASVLAAEELSARELDELVANLKRVPLGVDERVRISLAGVQEKLALTRLPSGAWGRPINGAPSTHILKPEIPGYPHTVENEAFCMRLVRNLGLPAPDVDTTTIAGRRLIVVTRFDREVDASGRVRRRHQEDICQAVGIPPGRKYQEDGGPSLATLAGILRANDPESLDILVQATTINVLVGNGDAHAKNFSLMYGGRGEVRLAPLYDVLSTLLYGDERLAMYIDTVQRTSRVTARRIVNEAAGWGMTRAHAIDVASEILERAAGAVERSAREIHGVPDSLIEIVERQHRLLLSDIS